MEQLKKVFRFDMSKPLFLCRYTVTRVCLDLTDDPVPQWGVPADLTQDFLSWLAKSPWSRALERLQGNSQMVTGEPLVSMWIEEEELDAFLAAAIKRYPQVSAFRDMASTSDTWRAKGPRMLDITGFESRPSI